MKKLILLFIGAVLFLPVLVLARIGVGVATGKIVVDQKLKPGFIYNLPPLTVLNTGDEPSDYGVSIQYHEGQENNPLMGLKPEASWFTFEPANFHLNPGQAQQVKIQLALPIKNVRPGTYFCYLEANPFKKSVSGQTSIGVAAATKLYFTVEPANIFSGIYYRLISLAYHYYPWDLIVLIIILGGSLVWFLSKKFKFQIVKK